MDYYVIHTLAAGRTKRRVAQFRITGVPAEATRDQVTEALEGSAIAPQVSELGLFLANRQVHPEPRVPADAERDNCEDVPWAELAATKLVQLNVRIPAASRARWQRAAAGSGLSLAKWLEQAADTAARS